MLRYISVDLETTGFSPEVNEIIEIGAWKVQDGVVIDKFHHYIKPVCAIPRNIEMLTGIFNEDLVAEEPVETVLVEFFDWCEDYPFLGQNLGFDYRFLCSKGRPLGLDFSLNKSRMGYDTLKLAKRYLKLENYKLETIVNYFGINIDKLSTENNYFHSAKFDAYVTKLVFDRFIQMGNDLLEEQLTGDEYGEVVENATLSFK